MTARTKTRYFGELSYAEEDIFAFAGGIPGFEEHTGFLFLDVPQFRPLVFMQSVRDEALCFIAIPVLAANPSYRLHLAPEDLRFLGAPGVCELRSEDLIALALVTIADGHAATANLMSPVVLYPAQRSGRQVIQSGSDYAFRHPLVLESESVSCL